jgi:CHAD domain-containing protein
MAYRFKAGKSVAENIRRIAAEETADAVKQLGRSGTKQRDEAIHEARKAVKKLRGLLRLVRPCLETYGEENRALRDIGRGLSALRDTGAIIETFNSVIKENAAAWKPASAAAIRNGLRAKKREKEKELIPARVMNEARIAIRRFGQRAEKWQLADSGFEMLAPGLHTTYQDGRRAMRLAADAGDPVLFHGWRKRAKDHWYHVRLLNDIWVGTRESRENALHDLETSLGEDHNLVVLCEQLRTEPSRFGGEETVGLFVAAAKAKQKELRQKALEVGARLYEQKPKLLVRDFEEMWDLWRSEKKRKTAP